MQDYFTAVWHDIQGYYNNLVSITPKLVVAIIIVSLAWILASWLRSFANVRLQRRMHDPLLATFIANLLKAILIVIGLLLMLQIVGLTGIAGTVLAGAGISAFIIGFALKDIGENFLAGILLAFKRPFTIGDIIESNGVKGKVIALNLRDTQIKSDGKDIYVPNAMLIKSTLINYNSAGYLLQELIVGLEYGADYDQAIALIKKILEEQHEVTDDGLDNTVVISGVSSAVVQLSIHYWVKTDKIITDGQTRSRLIVRILEVLKENGYNVK